VSGPLALVQERLVEDPYAEPLVAKLDREALAKMEDNSVFGKGALQQVVALRTRFIDDFVVEALQRQYKQRVERKDHHHHHQQQQQKQQLVIIGAGLDTRVLRLPFPSGADVTVFELDLPDVLAHKEELLHEIASEFPAVAERLAHRRSVDIDLTQHDWFQSLLKAGFSAELPSVWIVEGLTMYLTQDAVHALLEHMRRLSAAGSEHLVHLVSTSLVNEVESFGSEDVRFTFGTDAPLDLLQSHGFSNLTCHTYQQLIHLYAAEKRFERALNSQIGSFYMTALVA